MKIWVIGSSGMLGSCIVNCAQKRSIPIVATGSEIDITSYSLLEQFYAAHKPNFLINCAAYTHVDLAEQESDLAFALNVVGAENLGRLAETYHVKLLHFSTDYVFSGDKQSPYNEEDECSPLSIYGQTKREGERRLLQKSIDLSIVRTSWLFGKKPKHFVAKILEKMRKQKEVFVVADQIGRPTFCDDLAEASLSLFPYQGIFHFANQGVTSWYEFAKTIFSMARERESLICEKVIPIHTSDIVTLAKRPMYSVLDTNKVETLLQISPRHWELGLEDYFLGS